MLTWFPFDICSRSVWLCLRPSPALDQCRPRLAAAELVGESDDLVADDLVREAEHPVELGHNRGLCGRLNDDVIALVFVVEFVREPPLAPPVDLARDPSPGRDQIGGSVDGRPDDLLIQASVEDD